MPAPGINGYSLDLMRRDNNEHPNGLLDFAVVETIRYLKAHGKRGLGLNFATMRAVLAGEAGDGMSQRIQAWFLRRMSDSMQIESLWKFNAKFDPDWQPRYALYDSPEHALPALIAVARAESFWELPVIGRFLVPSAPVVPSPTGTNGTNGSPPAESPAPAPRISPPPAPGVAAPAPPRRRSARAYSGRGTRDGNASCWGRDGRGPARGCEPRPEISKRPSGTFAPIALACADLQSGRVSGGGRLRSRLWNPQAMRPLSWLVGPPASNGTMWSAWQSQAGTSQNSWKQY